MVWISLSCYHQPMEDSMERSRNRLNLLLRDYEQSREDERQGSAAFSNLLAAALASAFAALVILYQRPENSNSQIGFWISVIAPVAILLPTVYAGLIGAISTARSYYLRVLEDEISREMQKVCGEGSLELTYSDELRFPAFSSVTFATVRASPKHGKGISGWFLTFVAVVFSAANVMMLNIAYNAMLMIGSLWANVYFFAYLVVIIMLAKHVYDIGLNGRAYFVETAKEVLKRREAGFGSVEGTYEDLRQKLKKGTTVSFDSPDTLRLFPKPDDLVKIAHEATGAIIACLFLYNRSAVFLTPRRILVLVIFLLFFEGFVYQTRYIANDILGAKEESLLLSCDRRSRLTSDDTEGVFIASRNLVLRVMLILLAIVPIWYTDLILVYLLGVCFLVLLTASYEWCRHRLATSEAESVKQKCLSVAVYLLVSLGEPLRLLVGYFTYMVLCVNQTMSIAKACTYSLCRYSILTYPCGDGIGTVIILLALWGALLALVSVPLTWLLEALCQVTFYGNGCLYVEWRAEGKRHAFYALRRLMSPLGVRVIDHSCQVATPVQEELSPRRAFGLVRSQPLGIVRRSLLWLFTPWTFGAIAAVPCSVMLGASVFNVDVPLPSVVVLSVIIAICTLLLQELYFKKSNCLISLILSEPVIVYCWICISLPGSPVLFNVVTVLLSFMGGYFWFFYLTLEYSKTRGVLRKLLVSASVFDKLLAVRITDHVLNRVDSSNNVNGGVD